MPPSPLHFFEGNASTFQHLLANSTVGSESDTTSFNSLHPSLPSQASIQVLNTQNSMHQTHSCRPMSTLPLHQLTMPLLSSSFPDACSFSSLNYSTKASKSSSTSCRLSIKPSQAQHIQKPIQTIPYGFSGRLTHIPSMVENISTAIDVTVSGDHDDGNKHESVADEWYATGQRQEEMEKERKKRMRSLVDLLSTDWSTKEDAPVQWHEINSDTIVNSHNKQEDTSSETSTTYSEQDARPFRILKDAIPKSQLKSMCEELGLLVGGNKGQLAERLDHYCVRERITAYDVRAWFKNREEREKRIEERPILKGKKRMRGFRELTVEITEDEDDSRNYSRENPKRVRATIVTGYDKNPTLSASNIRERGVFQPT